MTLDVQHHSQAPLSSEQIAQLEQMDRVLEQVREMLENETPRASELLEQVLNQTIHEPHDEFQRRRAYALLLVSRLSYRYMNFSESVAHGLESLSIYEMLEDVAGLHESNYLLGIYHIRFSDNVQAMDNLIKAVDYAEQIQDYKGIGSASLILSVVFRNMEQYERALERLDYALKMKLKSQDMYGQAIVYSNMARTLAYMKRFDEAIKHAQKGIETAKQPKSSYLLVECHLALGDVYAQAEYYLKAIEQFERCLLVCREHEWLELEIATASKVGSAYLGIDDVKKAIEILETGLQASQEHLSTYITTDILKVLAQAYEAASDYQKAYLALKQLQEIQRQQITAERSARLHALEQGYQMRIARQEANLQRERAEELAKLAEQDRDYFEHLNQMRDEFLNEATHDLKNPLASIRTSVYLLRQKMVRNDSLQRHIDVIDKQSNRMVDLIADMLELAKLETGRALHLNLASLNTLIGDVVDGYQPIATHEQVQIICDCHLDKDHIMLQLDTSLMKRAIGNVLSNAIKYSHAKGQVTVKLVLSESNVQVRIADEGMGIAESDLPHIFTHFYRVDSDRTQEVEGTGLGLAIVKTIVQQHNGQIQVESQVDVGTTFTITLPT